MPRIPNVMGRMRNRSGLRNKTRTGRSTYCAKDKSSVRDFYGTWINGRRTSAEKVNGRTIPEMKDSKRGS
jgi:hypothetical protein